MKLFERTYTTVEFSLYIVAFTLALGVRLLNLGTAPLSDYEAVYTLQSHNLAMGQPDGVGLRPAYVVLTGLIFTLFKESESTARLIPVLAGSLLVFLPLIFENISWLPKMPRGAGAILAFGLALDPALVMLSRMAGSPLLALVFLFLALGFALRANASGTGIFGTLALMSGPEVFTGLLGWGIIAAVIWTLSNNNWAGFNNDLPSLAEIKSRRFWIRSFMFAGGTFLIVGLGWLALPQGLAGITSGLTDYLAGWTQASGIPALRLPAALLLYQPLAITFGLAAILQLIFRGDHEGDVTGKRTIFLALWVLGALLPGFLYPSRQVFDAMWVLIPLWILAAMQLSHFVPINLDRSLRLPALGMAGAFGLFLVMIWYNLLRLQNLQAQSILYIAIVGGLVIMVVIVIILVALGWTPAVASTGLAWGLTAVAGITMLAGMWGMSQLRTNQPAELWSIGPGTGQNHELLETINEFSQWQKGLNQEIDVFITLDSPALRWTLRNFKNASFGRIIPATQQPSIILSSAGETQPRLASTYRGQELVWRRIPTGYNAFPPNLLRWFTFRELVTTPETIIVWVRNDLFFDEDLTGAGTNFETAP